MASNYWQSLCLGERGCWCIISMRQAGRVLECLHEGASAPRTERADTAALSIATNGSEARPFMTWKEDADTFEINNLRPYCLAEENHCINFPKVVYNIIKWYHILYEGFRRQRRLARGGQPAYWSDGRN